jgi:sirohydrochlorin ferrochelatase
MHHHPEQGTATALIVIDHGSRLGEANEMLSAVADRLRSRAQYPIVEYAHMELAPPDLKTAFARCVERGARQIVIVPYFLSPGNHASNDIPAQAVEAAAPYPEVSWRVASPLGLDDRLLDVVEFRASEALKAD